MQARTRTRLRLAAAGAAVALALAGCGDDSGTKAAANTPAAANTTTTAADTTTTAGAKSSASAGGVDHGAAGVTVKVASTSLGNVLVDGAGRTLYVFTKDEKGKSNCTGGCLSVWPPLYGTATAGDGVTASKLSTITTGDGKTQVAIDGMPLYYFGGDSAPGDVKGQNVNQAWFVVDGAGVMKKAS